MLEGTIKYKNYEILARAIDEVLDIHLVLTANDSDTVDMFDEISNSSGSFFRNFQVNKTTYKSEIKNREFGAILSASIRYAKSNCLPIYRDIMFKSNSDFIPDAVATYNIPNMGTVKLDMGLVTYMDIKTDLIEIHLEDVFCEEVNFGVFDGKSYTSKITKETIGFDISEKKEESGELNGVLYETLEEIIENNPEKDFSWLRKMDFNIVTDETLEEVCEYFMNTDKPIAMDTETSGLKITFKSRTGEHDVLTGVILSDNKYKSYYFPLQHRRIKNLCNGDHEYVMGRYIKKILETKPIICHNGTFDWKVCYIYDINTNIVFDTMIAFQCTWAYKQKGYKVGLKDLTKTLFGRDSLELSDLVRGGKWGENEVDFRDLTEELVRYYACADGSNTLELYEFVKNTRMLEEFGAEKVFEIEILFSKCVSYQEFYGHRVNIDEIPELQSDIDRTLAENYQKMKAIIGHDFNPSSAQQMQKILYEELGLPPQKKYDKGKYKVTCDKNAREELMSMETDTGEPLYPVVYYYNEYCNASSIKSNFLKNLGTLSTEDGFLFTQCGAFNTTTGRVSTKEPNYQSYNKPVKTRIIPRKGYYVTDNDYSSIEYRVLASMSGEKKLVEAFKDPDLNYHTYQASRIFDIPYESVSDALRKQAKGINFGLPYGMGDASLGARVFGERTAQNTKKAGALRDKYFVGQNRVKAFFENGRARSIELGYSETFFGRRRWYDKTKTDIETIRRQSGNAIIQGTAADLYKLAVGRLFTSVCKNGWLGKVFFSAFVHDAITCEVHESINPMLWLKTVKKAFEIEIDGWCDLYIGFGFGRNWHEAHSIEIPVQLQNELVEKYSENCPFWDGDVPKFCDLMADKIAEYEIRTVNEYLSNQDNMGKVIDPVVNKRLIGYSNDYVKKYLADKQKYLSDLDITSLVSQDEVKEYIHKSGDLVLFSELNSSDLLKYKNKYLAYEFTLDELGSKLSDGKKDKLYSFEEFMKERNLPFLEEYRPTKELQIAVDIFSKVNNLDRDSIDVREAEHNTSNKSEDKDMYEQEEEDLRKEVENLKLARVENFGVCVDSENNCVILNLVNNQSLMKIVQSKLNRDGRGYSVKLFSFDNNTMYETPSFIDYKVVSEVQQLYMIANKE